MVNYSILYKFVDTGARIRLNARWAAAVKKTAMTALKVDSSVGT